MDLKTTTSGFGEFNSIEEQFRKFLYSQVEQQGYSKSKQISWVEYMLDTSRPKKIATDFFSDFNPGYSKGDKALDIGCGFGSLMISLQPYFEQVCGIDINEKYVEWSSKRNPYSEVIHADAKNLPWSDNIFDLVCATDVFEHLEYDAQKQVASEVMRVLKPGGYGIIIVPNRFQILDEHNKVLFGTWLPTSLREPYTKFLSKNKHYDKCWERTGKGWKQLLESQGFTVSSLNPYYMKGMTFLKYLLVPPNRYKLYIQKAN